LQKDALKKLDQGEVWHGAVGLVPVRLGWAGFGLAWFFNSSLQKDALKKLDQGEVWHGAVGRGKARHGLVW